MKINPYIKHLKRDQLMKSANPNEWEYSVYTNLFKKFLQDTPSDEKFLKKSFRILLLMKSFKRIPSGYSIYTNLLKELFRDTPSHEKFLKDSFSMLLFYKSVQRNRINGTF